MNRKILRILGDEEVEFKRNKCLRFLKASNRDTGHNRGAPSEVGTVEYILKKLQYEKIPKKMSYSEIKNMAIEMMERIDKEDLSLLKAVGSYLFPEAINTKQLLRIEAAKTYGEMQKAMQQIDEKILNEKIDWVKTHDGCEICYRWSMEPTLAYLSDVIGLEEFSDVIFDSARHNLAGRIQ